MSDSDSPIPFGYCQCGCGRKTNLAAKTDRASGRVAGWPMRYIRGHHRRRPDAFSGGPNPSGLCLCGCGLKTSVATRTDGDTIKGYPKKYCLGHGPLAIDGEGPNPSGLCMCGCGERTSLAVTGNRKTGAVKGKPKRYVLGHSARVGDFKNPDLPPPNPSGLCMCGCGQETKIATRNNYSLGHVKGESLPYINGHNPVKQGPLYVVDEKTGCWIWQRSTARNGYGTYWHPEKKCSVSAHRYMYELHVGPIPEGLQVHHICNNRACVNPGHLEVLSPTKHVQKGGPTKVTEHIVAEIKTLWGTGCYTQSELADRFGIGQMTVSDIVTGVTWSDHPRERKLR